MAQKQEKTGPHSNERNDYVHPTIKVVQLCEIIAHVVGSILQVGRWLSSIDRCRAHLIDDPGRNVHPYFSIFYENLVGKSE